MRGEGGFLLARAAKAHWSSDYIVCVIAGARGIRSSIRAISTDATLDVFRTIVELAFEQLMPRSDSGERAFGLTASVLFAAGARTW